MRDAYIAMMVAAAKGKSVRLTAEECEALAKDGLIARTAKSRLDRPEMNLPWTRIDAERPRPHQIAEWRAVPGFEEYEVSSLGQVRHGARILKATAARYGHSKVSLYSAEAKRRVGVHQLVAEVFHGPAPEGKPFACHENGHAWDDRADNIYWGSRAENDDDRRRHRRVGKVEILRNSRPAL